MEPESRSQALFPRTTLNSSVRKLWKTTLMTKSNFFSVKENIAWDGNEASNLFLSFSDYLIYSHLEA